MFNLPLLFSPNVVRVDLVDPDPAEDDLPPHEDLEEIFPGRPGPDGWGPEGGVITEDVFGCVGVLQGGAAGDAGGAEWQQVAAVRRGHSDLNSRERSALF